MIRGFSLTQPWASLVAIGAKQWETRSWPTPYRGQIAIHASKKYPKDCRELEYEQPFLSALNLGLGDRAHMLPTGSIIALAVITDCQKTERFVPPTYRAFEKAVRVGGDGALVPPIVVMPDEYAFGDYSDGRYAFRLEKVMPLRTPIECKGALSLWTIPDGVIVQLREQFVEMRKAEVVHA